MDLLLFELWNNTILRWVSGNQPFPHRPIRAVVQHHVGTPDVACAHAGIPVCLFPNPPICFHIVVQLLYVPPSQLGQLDVPDPRHDVVLNVVLVKFLCAFPDVRL